MPAKVYRRAVSVVKRAGTWSVIQDNGSMTKAHKGDGDAWVFSEYGAGRRPLLVIGTARQLLAWLAKERHASIRNDIKELPDIYMGIGRFKPGSRFVGLFPLEAAVGDITKGLAGFGMAFIPGLGDLFNTASADLSMRDVNKFYDPDDDAGKVSLNSSAGAAASQDEYVVTFGYIQEGNMRKVGRNRMPFYDLREIFDNTFG